VAAPPLLQAPMAPATSPARPPSSSIDNRTGTVPGSVVGRAGERQTSFQAKGIKPMIRQSGRISSRIQLRLRNRIDSTFSPDMTASSSIESGDQQVRRSGQPR
jgi:hypothetical protein